MAEALTGEAVVLKMLALRAKHHGASQAELHGLFRDSLLPALPAGAAQWFGDTDKKGRGRKVRTILDRVKDFKRERGGVLVLKDKASKLNWYVELWAPDAGSAGIDARRAKLRAPPPPKFDVTLASYWSRKACRTGLGALPWPVRAAALTLHQLQHRWERIHTVGALFLPADMLPEILKFVLKDGSDFAPPEASDVRARVAPPLPTPTPAPAQKSKARSAAAMKGVSARGGPVVLRPLHVDGHCFCASGCALCTCMAMLPALGAYLTRRCCRVCVRRAQDASHEGDAR